MKKLQSLKSIMSSTSAGLYFAFMGGKIVALMTENMTEFNRCKTFPRFGRRNANTGAVFSHRNFSAMEFARMSCSSC